MNNYSISKVIKAMEDEIKDCFRDMVKESFGGSVNNLKQNLSGMICGDTKIREILEKYLEE